MRFILFLSSIFIIGSAASAQAPGMFKYQGLARYSSGNPVTNQAISLRITIHQTNVGGAVVYRETHSTTTNQFGAFNINVGGGTVLQGNFATIPWANFSYFQETEMDINGGSSFVSMGTSQYLSVPYALAADSALFGHDHFKIQSNGSGNSFSDATLIVSSLVSVAPAIYVSHTGTGTGIKVDCQSGRAVELESNGINKSTFKATNFGGGEAGIFVGPVTINGSLNVTGAISKGSGSFKIDHPLDPKNKFLFHSFVESPDMKNIYDGTVITDAMGIAEVKLPSYFEALNKDFRYQLTAIGQFAQAIISEKIRNNIFKIKTDKPHVEISWQVTGIRKDAFAEKYPIIPEVEKTGNEKGNLLYPRAYDDEKMTDQNIKNR